VSNAITEALDQAVERVGKALGQDAGSAIEKLYRDTDGNLKDVIERTTKADADKADEIKKIADDMAKNADKDVTTQAERNAQADTQAGLRKKLTGILDPEADPNAGIRGLGRDDPDVESLKTQAATRAGELQNSVPENSRGRITMGTSIGRDEAGSLRTVVSTSERRGYLRPGVTLKDGEELATGDGHAEPSGIDYMHDHGITPVAVGAGKPICTPCETTIDNAGAAPATKLKGSGPRPTKRTKVS
jgi:hypothetical protein